MKLVCSQGDLERALTIVSKAITPNPTLPVLNNILLKAEDKKLHFSATNLDVAIQFFIPADVKSEGAITVPARLLSSYVTLLKDKNIELSVLENNTVQLDSPSSHTKIKGIDANEFPVIPKIETEATVIVPRKVLEEAITQTVFAASTNSSRPVLSGVLFDVKKGEMKMVATDSYRLAEKTITLPKEAEKEVACIVPARTVMEMGKILARAEEENVELNVSKNQILFVVGNVRLMSRLIEGKFPPYEKVVPKDSKTKLEILDESLANVLRRVSLFARENNNSIKLSATNDGKLMVSTDETRVGEEKAELDVVIEGENNKISLNAQYLLDVLNYVQSEKIQLGIDDKLSPAVVRPAKSKDYVYIIMPLKV